jgi:hypothetical protein
MWVVIPKATAWKRKQLNNSMAHALGHKKEKASVLVLATTDLCMRGPRQMPKRFIVETHGGCFAEGVSGGVVRWWGLDRGATGARKAQGRVCTRKGPPRDRATRAGLGSFERVSFHAFSGVRIQAGIFNSFVTHSRPEAYM